MTAGPARSTGWWSVPGRSVRLRLKTEPAAPVLRAAFARLWHEDAGLADRYRAYLVAMHQVIRASVPLLEQAAARCDLLAHDPAAAPLGAYLRRHATEEQEHDDWLIEDAALLGMPARELTGPVPPPDVARLVGPAGYWAAHHHPVTLLGYMSVLESHAPSPRLAGRLAAATGLPSAAFRTVRDHAQLDSGHTRALHRVLDRLPLGPDLETAVGVCALHTTEAAASLFGRLAGASRPVHSALPHPARGAIS